MCSFALHFIIACDDAVVIATDKSRTEGSLDSNELRSEVGAKMAYALYGWKEYAKRKGTS